MTKTKVLWIHGRIENIPDNDNSVQVVIVERTPLNRAGVRELLRVIRPGGTIVLRHAVAHDRNAHEYAGRLISAIVAQKLVTLDNQQVCETILEGVSKKARECN